MRPDGTHAQSTTRHLFRTWRRSTSATPEVPERLVVELNGLAHLSAGLLRPAFPGLIRNRWTVRRSADYDPLVFVANWPSPRCYAWSTLS